MGARHLRRCARENVRRHDGARTLADGQRWPVVTCVSTSPRGFIACVTRLGVEPLDGIVEVARIHDPDVAHLSRPNPSLLRPEADSNEISRVGFVYPGAV